MSNYRFHLLIILFLSLFLCACVATERYTPVDEMIEQPVVTAPTATKEAATEDVDLSVVQGRYQGPLMTTWWIANKLSEGVYGRYGVCGTASQGHRIAMVPNGTKVLAGYIPNKHCDDWLWVLLADEEVDGFWVKRADLRQTDPTDAVVSKEIKYPAIKRYIPRPKGHQDGTLRRIRPDTTSFEDNYYIIDEDWPAETTVLYGSNAEWSDIDQKNCRVFLDWEWYQGFPDHLEDPKEYSPSRENPALLRNYYYRGAGSGPSIPYVQSENSASLKIGFDESILFILRLGTEVTSLETANCGTWSRIEQVSDDELYEDRLYLVDGLPQGTYSTRYTNIPYEVGGLLEQGVYRSSGSAASNNLCRVYKLTGESFFLQDGGAGMWIDLGYNEHYELQIDNTWLMFASTGCGTWQHYSSDLSGPIIARVEPPESWTGDESAGELESIWSYCARVGADDLSGELPEHLRTQLDTMLSYPGPLWVEDYVGRCGFTEGSDTATFLVCNPFSQHTYVSDRWNRWANYPIRNNCYNRWQIGDTSTSALGTEWAVWICNRQCDDPRFGSDGRYYLWWKSYGPSENGLLSAYLEDGYLVTSLNSWYREIDRNGYFSKKWVAVPRGFTPFEAEELRYDSPFTSVYSRILDNWNGDSKVLTMDMVARAKCLLEQDKIEVSYVIPDGPPIKVPDLLAHWNGFTKEYLVKEEEPYKSRPLQTSTEESRVLMAYRHGLKLSALDDLNGWRDWNDYPDAGDTILVPDYDRALIFEFSEN